MKFNSVAPILPSLNFEETKAFYTEKLGFAIKAYYEDEYLIVERDGVGLHFWICNDKKICESSGCYIYVSDIDAIYKSYEEKGIIHPNGTLRLTYYKLKEFAVLDCHGNLLRIGELMETTDFIKGQENVIANS